MKITSKFFGVLLLFSIITNCGVKPQDNAIDNHPNEKKYNQNENRVFDERWVSLTLESAANLRRLEEGVLENLVLLPIGSNFKVNLNTEIVQYPYRAANGNLERSSSGFYSDIVLVSVPNWSQETVNNYNNNPQGRFLSANIINALLSEQFIDPLVEKNPESPYFEKFENSGKPKFNFSTYYKDRFGSRLNLVIDPDSISPAQKQKWNRIFNELSIAGNRTDGTEGYLLYTSQAEATERSIRFENEGILSPDGSWTVAVKGTARRHDFEEVPCAEFMSEMLRAAYARAGYSILDDFNDTKENPLIWSNTAAVVNLANALFKAGWIPWEAAKYKPVTGALMMHYKATTPGHAYMAAGKDGRYIVDNGSPRGRDLGQTSDSIISKMYMHGVFFLPPGFTPQAW